MNIQNLIWARAYISEPGEPKITFANVSVSMENGGPLNIREYTSSQGVSTERHRSYAHPEIISMSPQRMVLKAYTWGRTHKDDRVEIVLEF